MELRFIKQRHEDAITELDEVELVNCTREDGYENGPYTVACVEQNGEITLVGKGPLEGYVAMIQMN